MLVLLFTAAGDRVLPQPIRMLPTSEPPGLVMWGSRTFSLRGPSGERGVDYDYVEAWAGSVDAAAAGLAQDEANAPLLADTSAGARELLDPLLERAALELRRQANEAGRGARGLALAALATDLWRTWAAVRGLEAGAVPPGVE